MVKLGCTQLVVDEVIQRVVQLAPGSGEWAALDQVIGQHRGGWGNIVAAGATSPASSFVRQTGRPAVRPTALAGHR